MDPPYGGMVGRLAGRGLAQAVVALRVPSGPGTPLQAGHTLQTELKAKPMVQSKHLSQMRALWEVCLSTHSGTILYTGSLHPNLLSQCGQSNPGLAEGCQLPKQLCPPPVRRDTEKRKTEVLLSLSQKHFPGV